jgi:hypothetical protein
MGNSVLERCCFFLLCSSSNNRLKLLLSQFFGKSGRKNLTPKWKIPSGTVLTAENFSKHEIVKEKFRSLCKLIKKAFSSFWLKNRKGLEEVFRDLGSGWLQEKIGVGSKAALIPKAVVAFGKYKVGSFFLCFFSPFFFLK